jgi:hypothetical protein
MAKNGTHGSGWLSWLRGLPRSSVLVFCAALLAAVQTVLGLLEAPVRMRVVGMILVLAVAGASELDKLQAKRREQREAEEKAREIDAAKEEEWQRQAEDALRLWPLPTMAEADPYALGVARSHLAEQRDLDCNPRVLRLLQAQGLLLINGSPASGATRSAYELARAESTRRLVVAPRPPHGLRTALDDLDLLSRLAPPARLLLWLDRVDQFTGSGLTATMLNRCRKASPGLRVVATISSNQYEVWATENREVAAECPGGAR